MVSNGISLVQVNPYPVKQPKEIKDNSQRKDGWWNEGSQNLRRTDDRPCGKTG